MSYRRLLISLVGFYSWGGVHLCTGALINSAVGDGTPYVLMARMLVVYWNYQTTTCGQAPPNGSMSQNQQGVTFAARWSRSDFSLLKLNRPPNAAWNIHFSRWDQSGSPLLCAIAIHHPASEKLFSFENDPTMTTNYSCNTVNTTGTHIRVADWDMGTTKPGSSGLLLFNANGRMVGQLSSGSAACGNNLHNWFGCIWQSWEGGQTPTT
jgi:lysyl endopeptidase